MPVKISMAAVRFNHMTKFGTENYNKNKDIKQIKTIKYSTIVQICQIFT
jgi:hypothetical protein